MTLTPSSRRLAERELFLRELADRVGLFGATQIVFARAPWTARTGGRSGDDNSDLTARPAQRIEQVVCG